MPSVIKRAVNAVKDQASVSLARFSKNSVPGSSCNLDVAIIKATSHEEKTAKERYTTEVIFLVVSSSNAAAACVHALARRIARTHNWVVALKSLHLTYHLLCDGGTYFCHEAASLRPIYSGGRCLLDLSNFSASQSRYSNPWDFTAFVRTYARYLDARLESELYGKLRNLNHRGSTAANLVKNMKPDVILDHMEHWRHLLDRAISMKPTGPARNNRLVHITLFMVTRESFDFYRDITTGLTVLLDKFFQLDRKCRIKTIEACEYSVNQFEELDSLYDLCIKIGVGSMVEYPRVQMISQNLVSTLKACLHDSLVSVESSPASETRPRLSLQALPRKMSEEFGSDSYSIASEPTSAQKRKAHERVHSSLMPFETLKEKTKQPGSEGWERLLVETAGRLSNSKNNSYVQELMPESAKRPPPQNYKNPFVQEYYNQDSITERSIVVKPSNLSLQDYFDKNLITEKTIADKPKNLLLQYSYEKESFSTDISIAEKPTDLFLEYKNSSTERTISERAQAFAEAEKRFKPPARALTAPLSQQPLFQKHLRWMEEQQKVYRSMGR